MACKHCAHCRREERIKLAIGRNGDVANVSAGILIADAIAAHYNIAPKLFLSKNRTSRVAGARQVAMYLIRTLTDMSYPAIGILFGRDHSTVVHAYQLMDKRMKTRPMFKQEIDHIAARLVAAKSEAA